MGNNLVNENNRNLITVELPKTIENGELVNELKSLNSKPIVFIPKRLSGGIDLVTIVVPITIGVIQVIATFLSARVSARKEGNDKSNNSSVRILIDDKVIEADNLTPDYVERIIGKVLDVEVKPIKKD